MRSRRAPLAFRVESGRVLGAAYQEMIRPSSSATLRLVVLLVLAGCATVHPAPRNRSEGISREAIPRTAAIVAVGAATDGSHVLFARSSSGRCELFDAEPGSKAVTLLGPLDRCPDRISTSGGAIDLEAEGEAWRFSKPGTTGGSDVVLRGAKAEVARVQGGRLEWRDGGRSRTLSRSLHRIRFMPDGSTLIGVERTDTGESIVTVAADGRETKVVGPFRTIDSYDVSPEGTDVAFSASRNGGFDVAIVSATGGKPRWIYPDPRDERRVIWAPLGHKIAYVIESIDGSILRSVHIPTGAMVEVSFPWTRVDSVAWMPDARRVAVAESSVLASSHVELVHYDGNGRQEVVPPVKRLAASTDLLPNSDPRAIVLPPLRPRYGVRDPLVIRVADGGAAGWSDGQAAILGRTGAGMIIVRRGVSSLGGRFWKAVDSLGWVDHGRIFVVEDDAGSLGSMPPGVTVVASGGRRGRGVVIVRADSGSDFEDAAASWIIGSLEGNS